jgi:ADP-dependent NAD(P)H-hydrate dehydratase
MTPRAVDADLLRGWPLPRPDEAGDKESRGRVLVVAGSREMPGAVLLAATAALHAGAGKLAVATAASVAPGIALALPEARVIALPESPRGGMRAEGLRLLEECAACTDAVVVGPGMLDRDAVQVFVAQLLALVPQAPVLLDALALDAIHALPARAQPVILTPHAGEMAHLTGASKDDVRAHAERFAREQARRWNAVVALKGATTVVADPEGHCWRHDASVPGLGTSGSGDVLAGLVGGLAARGADSARATVWGVALHAAAGGALAARSGALGYLARELSAEVPRLLHGWAAAAA